MIVTTVADLLDVRSVSTDRLDAALATCAPTAIAWCSRPGAALGRAPLREAVLLALPEALRTGLPECILRRWLPSQPVQRVVAPTDLHIEIELKPQLDLLHKGLPVFALALGAIVTLEQRGSSWQYDGTSAQIGEPRAWHARMKLHVADASGFFKEPPFHEARLDVLLPSGPWPL